MGCGVVCGVTWSVALGVGYGGVWCGVWCWWVWCGAIGVWVRNMYDDLLRLTPTFCGGSVRVPLPYVMNMFGRFTRHFTPHYPLFKEKATP